MSIKKVYDEVVAEKSTKVGDKSKISMDVMEFIEEHEDLIEILREGSREELLAEADKQEKELEKCYKDHNMTPEDEDMAEGEDE